MTELRIPSPFDAESVPEWLGRWNALPDARNLSWVAARGDVLGPAGSTLLASIQAARRERALPAVGLDGFALPDLRPIETTRSAREIAEQARCTLEELRSTVSSSVARLAAFVFEELCANAAQHSGSPHTSFGMLQVEPRAQRLEICVCDAGQGFLASLTRNPELRGQISDEGQAIQYALHPRISSGQPGNLGVGLAMLTRMCETLGGTLRIHSGDALFVQHAIAGRLVGSVRSAPRWQGAWVYFEAPLVPA